LGHQGALDNLRKFQFRFQPSSFGRRIVIEADLGCIVHFEQARVHDPVTDLTNTQHVALDLFEAGVYDMKVFVNSTLRVTQAGVFFSFGSRFEETGHLLAFFIQPEMDALKDIECHDILRSGWEPINRTFV
jgi:hypothetical protein